MRDKTVKKRRPWVAGLLTFVQPGLGHLYCGDWKQGLKFFIISQIVYFLAICTLLWVSFPKLNIILPIAFFVGFYFFIIRNAIQLAKGLNPLFQLPLFTNWYILLFVLIGVWIGSSFVTDEGVRTYLARAFKIPSGAMMPTVLIGDHVMVDKLHYRFNPPQRGDIIIFLYPKDETKTFIKRVVGLPRETVEIIKKQVFINGEKQNDQDYTQHVDPGIIDGDINPRDNYGPVTIPDNFYWVLGDNRDQSLDSRFFGFIERGKIIGKVEVIYWSGEGELGLSRIQWNRIGKRID